MKQDEEIQAKPITEDLRQGASTRLSPSIDNLAPIGINPMVPEISISLFDRVALWAWEAKEAGKFYGALAMFVFRVYAVVKSTSTTINGGIVFRDWKTTLVGIVGAVGVLVKSLFGFEIPAEVQNGFIAIILFFIGLFAKDSKPE